MPPKASFGVKAAGTDAEESEHPAQNFSHGQKKRPTEYLSMFNMISSGAPYIDSTSNYWAATQATQI